MILRSAHFGVAALALAATVLPSAHALAATSVREATLNDLGRYRSIAADALALSEKGDIAAAQRRGTDLETAWDEAEDTLKPTDPVRWRVVDKAIDRVLAVLRAAKPQQDRITAALRDLVALMDRGGAV